MKSVTGRLVVAGSLRRRKLEVGDVEILYVFDFAGLKYLEPWERF